MVSSRTPKKSHVVRQSQGHEGPHCIVSLRTAAIRAARLSSAVMEQVDEMPSHRQKAPVSSNTPQLLARAWAILAAIDGKSRKDDAPHPS